MAQDPLERIGYVEGGPTHMGALEPAGEAGIRHEGRAGKAVHIS